MDQHQLTQCSATNSSAADRLSPAEQVAADLRRLIAHEVPSARDLRLHSLVRAAGGLSRENWSVDASWVDDSGAHSHRLMLMRDAAGTLLNTERAREYAVLKALEGTPVPAPRVYWMDPHGHFLGAPSVVMERISGACDYMVLNGARPLEDRLTLARGFIALMAAIHQVDWRARGLEHSLGLPPQSPARAEVDHWEAEYRRVALEPHPELELVLNWLKHRAPKTDAIALVHGDFKPGNALVEGLRITAKLDWETAHLGDPLEDLGWVTNPVRKREHQIAGHWERRQIIDAYQALTGRSVDERDLLWWNALACWKLAVIQLTAVHEFVAGRYSRVFQTPTWLYRPMFQLMEAA